MRKVSRLVPVMIILLGVNLYAEIHDCTVDWMVIGKGKRIRPTNDSLKTLQIMRYGHNGLVLKTKNIISTFEYDGFIDIEHKKMLGMSFIRNNRFVDIFNNGVVYLGEIGSKPTAKYICPNMKLDIKKIEKSNYEQTKLFQKSCDNGDMHSCNTMASMYRQGKGVEKNDIKAQALFDKACKGGVLDACNNLAVIYTSKKDGRSDNYLIAASLFQKTCNSMSAKGCFGIGVMYMGGIGVDKNPQRAKELFNKACTLGDKESCSMYKKLDKVKLINK
jgi:hypothetical protein